MSQTSSPLSSLLAQLLLKSHHELSELLSRSSSSVFGGPLNVGVRVGKSEGSMSVDSLSAGQQGFTLAFSEDERSYKLVLEPRASAADPIKVRVTLLEGEKREEHVFDGADLFSAALPEQFRALHTRVLDYLKKMLPEALLAKLQAVPKTATATATNAPASATTSAATAATDATAPAPETDAAAPAPASADEYSWYHVRRDDQPDLRFRGKSLGCVHTAVRNGRQTTLEVFVTPSGKYVGIKLGLSYWLGERDIATVHVADTLSELVPFFGFSPLSKALYERLAVSTAEVLE
jgi:hypothetical protein